MTMADEFSFPRDITIKYIRLLWQSRMQLSGHFAHDFCRILF